MDIPANGIIRSLKLSVARALQNIYVDSDLYKSIQDKDFVISGYTFKVHKNIDAIALLLELPAFVNDIQGVHFELKLFKDGGELRLVYSIYDVSDDSPHKKQIDEYRCWDNPFLKSTTSFLLLEEHILNDADLIEAIQRTKDFLTENKIYERLQ